MTEIRDTSLLSPFDREPELDHVCLDSTLRAIVDVGPSPATLTYSVATTEKGKS